jgi:hypothetical protein
VRRLLVIVAGLLGLCACSAPAPAQPSVPDVTFATGGHSVAAQPLQYCDARLQHCLGHANPPVFLVVPAGAPVRISVPAQFHPTPWQVAARFRDTQGKEYVSCSAVFPPGTQQGYTVTPPKGYQLLLIEVYQVSATVGAGSDPQHVTFANSGVWSMVVRPPAGQQPELPKLGDNLCESAT